MKSCPSHTQQRLKLDKTKHFFLNKNIIWIMESCWFGIHEESLWKSNISWQWAYGVCVCVWQKLLNKYVLTQLHSYIWCFIVKIRMFMQVDYTPFRKEKKKKKKKKKLMLTYQLSSSDHKCIKLYCVYIYIYIYIYISILSTYKNKYV